MVYESSVVTTLFFLYLAIDPSSTIDISFTLFVFKFSLSIYSKSGSTNLLRDSGLILLLEG